jgi:hypothetical protein
MAQASAVTACGQVVCRQRRACGNTIKPTASQNDPTTIQAHALFGSHVEARL